MSKVSCIYKIISPDNYYYIGSTKDLSERFNMHLRNLKNGTHHNKYMQNCYNKYPVGWQCIMLEEVKDIKSLTEIEQKYINEHYKQPGCMNLSSIAGKPLAYKGMKKRPMSEHTKEKISLWRKGKPMSQSAKAKLSMLHKGKTWEEKYGVEGAKQRRENWKLRSLQSKLIS